MKNTKNIKVLLTILILISIISLTSFVNAFSVKMSLNSSSKLKAGDLVTVTLKITNIDAGDGIDAIVATLDYDKNVFEEVTEDSFEGINKWNVNIYSTETQMFTVTKSSKVSAASDILTVTLKAKDNISADSTTIKFKEITASGGAISDGGTGDIDIEEAKVTITKETSTNNPGANTEEGPKVNEIINIETNTTNTTSNIIKNENANKLSNVVGAASGKLPQTGENVIGITLGSIFVLIIAIIAYIKYRNINIK